MLLLSKLRNHYFFVYLAVQKTKQSRTVATKLVSFIFMREKQKLNVDILTKKKNVKKARVYARAVTVNKFQHNIFTAKYCWNMNLSPPVLNFWISAS